MRLAGGGIPILVGAWLLWCTLHSLLIARGVQGWLRRSLGRHQRFIRLAYNLFSAITLVPVLLLTRSLRGEPLFVWQGWLIGLRLLLLAGGLALFWAGARRYDLREFLGLRRLRSSASPSSTPSAREAPAPTPGPSVENSGLAAGGVLGMTRHPWYLGALLLIWTVSLDPALLASNIVLSLYLVLGTWLEERKLLEEHGNAYRAYQERVSMLFPWKWILARLGK